MSQQEKTVSSKLLKELIHHHDFVNFDPKGEEHKRYCVLNPRRKGAKRRVLIHGAAFVITFDEQEKLKLWPDHSVYIVGGKIKEVFPTAKKRIPASQIDLIYDASKRGKIVITPGFINAHAHPPMYLLRSSMTLDKGDIVGQVEKMARLEKKMATI